MEKENKKFNFKQYYDNNKEFRQRHLMKGREKVACICGCDVARWHLSRHKKSKKHTEYMNQLLYNIANQLNVE